MNRSEQCTRRVGDYSDVTLEVYSSYYDVNSRNVLLKCLLYRLEAQRKTRRSEEKTVSNDERLQEQSE